MAYAVITREADAAAAYAAALAPLGLDAVALPVTATAPARDPGALARALAAGGHAAIVIASARAAVALAAALGEARGGAALPEVWAVGPATARALAERGIACHAPAEARDAASLARALLAARALAGHRVLVPRAEAGRDELIDALRAAGAEVEPIAAYRTVGADPRDPAVARGLDLLRRGEAAVCAMFAPSQVTALDALIALRGLAVQFAAIGDTTGAALRAAGATHVAVAQAPTPEGLAKAVAAVYPRR
jgi:uroporphyrinogen-III synthase